MEQQVIPRQEKSEIDATDELRISAMESPASFPLGCPSQPSSCAAVHNEPHPGMEGQPAQAEGAGRSFHKNSTVQSLLNDEHHNFRWWETQRERGKEETDRSTHVKQDLVFHR
jgi:hypothetical protein